MLHHAVHAGAQRDLRPAARGVPAAGATRSCSSGRGWSTAALLAKIHTVEWTPAIISHPTTKLALRANWFGLAGERVAQAVRPDQRQRGDQRHPGRRDRPLRRAVLAHRGLRRGLPDAPADPRRVEPARGCATTARCRDCTFGDLTGPEALDGRDRHPDGRPALLVRHPATRARHAAQLPALHAGVPAPRRPPAGPRRDRHPPRPASWACRATTSSAGCCTWSRSRRSRSSPTTPRWAAEISAVYDGDIEKVDLSVGLYAEKRPQGFAFSDTAFRIFVLMASRRLNSDRFFTDHYTPEVYTPGRSGLDRRQLDGDRAAAPPPGAAAGAAGRDERVRGLAALLSASGPDLSVRPGRLDA